MFHYLTGAMRSRKPSEKILQKILDHKPSLSAETDKAGNTPLHYATLIGNTCAVKQLLLKDTGSVYKVNLSGSFPVHLAAEAGNVKVIKELLSQCPDVGKLLDKEKRNFLHVALHLAVISSATEIFELLCQNKRVNPNIRNEAGLTPLDISASLQDHLLTYSLIPQHFIHRALLKRGAFQNPCQPDLSKKVNNLVKARADCPNRTEGKEMCNDVGDDIEKELTKYENISKSLTTGAVLIASVTFVAIFTVSGVYNGGVDMFSPTFSPILITTKNVFMAFVIVDMLAFVCAIVSTIWLLYAAVSNFHPKYRKIYFQMCTPLLYGAFYLFILTFGLGGYIAIVPHIPFLAVFILGFMALAFGFSVYLTPIFFPRIILRRFL